MKYLTKTIIILSAVSLFTDMASEMLYPVMPVYLKSIGFSIFIIGILEGVAEATAGLSKGYFGKMSDLTGKRVPFVRIGYALSAVSKPLFAVSVLPVWIFFLRTLDRFGKGIRTGARDALLSAESSRENKAKVFGFHRAMDTLGAVFGPLAALIWLVNNPDDYQSLFLIAVIPGFLAITSSLLLKDKKAGVKKADPRQFSFFAFMKYWKTAPSEYRKITGGMLVFAVFNSSDVFLLLKAKESGLNDSVIIGLYIFYNLIYSLTSFPMGILADKAGLKRIFIFGLALFAVVYTGMAFSSDLWYYGILFLIYGVYASATEGISKAWISNISAGNETATAIGTFTAFQSLSTMSASFITGFIWYRFGSEAALLISAAGTIAVMVYFTLLRSAGTDHIAE
ncbi:MAG: MFS transporter [Ignavibacteriaceae bacterium]|nr:MFS transporter [Ignavibacteriaceae bacterium]